MITTYFLNCVIGNVLKTKTSPALPTTYWLGVSSTAPTASGTGATEPSTSGSAYTRVQLSTSSLSQPTDGVITNTAEIAFPESTSDWGTMKYAVIYDSQTGGNLLMSATLDPTRSVELGTILYIKVGRLSIKFTSAS